MCVRTPRPDGGCHQCWTSPSTNCRLALISRCSRSSSGWVWDECHRVLQLIAKAVGAARLVVAAACPDAASQRLVNEPAVGKQVQGLVGRRHLHRAQHVLPVRMHFVQRSRVASPPRKRCTSCPASSMLRPHAETEGDLAPLSRSEFKGHLDRGARIQRRTAAAGQTQAAQGGGPAQRSIAPDELCTIAGEAAGETIAFIHVEEADPVAEVVAVGVARIERAVCRRRLRYGCGGRTWNACRRAPIRRNRCAKAPRPATVVAQHEAREFHCRVDGDEDREFTVDSSLVVLEHAVPRSRVA